MNHHSFFDKLNNAVFEDSEREFGEDDAVLGLLYVYSGHVSKDRLGEDPENLKLEDILHEFREFGPCIVDTKIIRRESDAHIFLSKAESTVGDYEFRVSWKDFRENEPTLVPVDFEQMLNHPAADVIRIKRKKDIDELMQAWSVAFSSPGRNYSERILSFREGVSENNRASGKHARKVLLQLDIDEFLILIYGSPHHFKMKTKHRGDELFGWLESDGDDTILWDPHHTWCFFQHHDGESVLAY